MLTLYHGTTQIIQAIDLEKGRHRTDFGKGFYLGTNLEIAQRWAINRAAFSGVPMIMYYSLDPAIFKDSSVNPLVFDEPTIEWLDFVCSNRRKDEKVETDKPRHQYGAVYGPIANDKVNFVIEDYMKGKITTHEAIAKAKALPNAMQVSLHTEKALKYLQSDIVRYQEFLSNGTWTDWKQF